MFYMCVSIGVQSENRNYSRCFQKRNLTQEICYTGNERSEKSSEGWWENLRSAKVEVGGREKSMLLKFRSKGPRPSQTMEDNSMGVGATEEIYLVRNIAQRKERGEISYFLPFSWSPISHLCLLLAKPTQMPEGKGTWEMVLPQHREGQGMYLRAKWTPG